MTFFNKYTILCQFIGLLGLIIFSACKKEKPEADLAFNFANVGNTAYVGQPFSINSSIINDVFPGVDNYKLPSAVKTAGASHRSISCEFRPDTFSVWQGVEIEDVGGQIATVIYRAVPAIASGEVLYFVDAIYCTAPGYYRFTLKLDTSNEVEERDETNNSATDNSVLRSESPRFNLLIHVEGDLVPGVIAKLKMSQ